MTSEVVPLGQPQDQGTPSPAHQVVRLIAARQQSRAYDIAQRIYIALINEVPEYAAIGDEQLAEDVRGVSMAGVVLWLDMVRTGRTPGGADLEPIRQGARRRARQGFDHYALLRAWRIAIRVMWSELIQDPEARDPDVRQVLPDVAEDAMNFSDQISLAVTDAYLHEGASAAREHERRRSALLELILTHPEEKPGPDQPPELSQPHVVVVAETADLPLDRLDRVGMELERRADAAFWTVRSHAVVAVIPVPAAGRGRVVTRLRRVFDALGEVRRIGVGGLSAAVPETRQSYVEAGEAIALGSQLDPSLGPVFDHTDVGSYSLLAADAPRAWRFIRTTLEPLAGIRAPWLEPTLEAFISRQGRVKEAAQQLQVHPNTIKYRLGEVRETLGPTLRDPDRAAELLLALRLRRLLSGAAPNPTRDRPVADL